MAKEFQEAFFIVATCIGFFYVSKSLINFLRWVWLMFLRPSKNLKQYGSWAIVTGSASGIGKMIALELASKGLNLLLIDKNRYTLEATCNEVREKFNGRVEIRNMVINLAKVRGEEIARVIEEEIKGLDVGVLINNVGMAYPYARLFNEVDLELMENIIKVNIGAATWVTRAVLPGMVKKKGAVVNMSSASAHLPSLPLYTLYSATKAYISIFSRCIGLEYKQHGIDIQCQAPLFVATELTEHLRDLTALSWLMPSAEKFGKASVRWIGYEPICNPYWCHSMQLFILRVISVDVVYNAIMYKLANGIRERGLLEEAEMKKKKKKMHQQGDAM